MKNPTHKVDLCLFPYIFHNVKHENLSWAVGNGALANDPAFTLVGHYPESASHYDYHKGAMPAVRSKIKALRAVKKQGDR